MIKFAFRRNSIYPGQYLIWTIIRFFLSILIQYKFEFSDSLIYSPLMFLGEFIAGALFHLYLRKIENKKSEQKEQFFMSIKLIRNEENDTDYFVPIDSKVKIIFLIFIASFFDALQFMNETALIPYYKRLSASLCMRLYGFATITASFTYVYTLKLPVYKHHKFSLSIIGICLIVIIALEYIYIYEPSLDAYLDLTRVLAYIIISQIVTSSQDSIEKYLFEFDYMNPFVVLMYEGLFGFLLTLFFFFYPRYLNDVKTVYTRTCENSPGKFILFIFLLFLYIIFSGLKNIFRVVTTKIYSPMAKMLTDFFLNPIYLIYYCLALDDFKNNGEINFPYFLLNIIISIIISFCGCIYNEFIILFCCDLDRDTHRQISERASKNLVTELKKIQILTTNINLSDISSISSNSDKESENL